MEDQKKEIYYESYSVVYHTLLKYANGDCHHAEDATQQAYLKYVQCCEQGMEIEHTTSWLIQVGKNHLFNFYKKGQFEQPDEEVEDAWSDAVCEEDPESLYMEKVEEDQKHQFTQMILEELKEKNRDWYTVLYRIEYRNESLHQVAENLNLTEEALRSRLRRAKGWTCKHYKIEYEHMIQNGVLNDICISGVHHKEADTIQVPASFSI